MRVHELKTDPLVFAAVASGAKTHEIRLNDRDYQVGDVLQLRETAASGADMRFSPKAYPLTYTGRQALREVSHVQTGYGLLDDWCILSFKVDAKMPPAGAWLELNHALEEMLTILREKPAPVGKVFTHKYQPGNTDAYCIGQAAAATMRQRSGDAIDIGLHLVKQLNTKGYGIVEVERYPATGEAA